MANEHDAILTALQTQLEGINGTAPYTITVREVERLAKSYAEVSSQVRPYIGIVHTRTSVQSLHGKQLRCVMSISLVCHDDAKRYDTRGDVLDDLIENVVTAIYSDVHIDNNATLARVTDWETDEGDATAGASVTALVGVEIVYHKDLSGI